MGKIYSTETNRVIEIGKAKYNELVGRGYVPDLQNGVLLAPGICSMAASGSSERLASSAAAAAKRAPSRGRGGRTPR